MTIDIQYLRSCLKSAVCRVQSTDWIRRAIAIFAHQPLIAPEGIKRLMKERDRDLEGVEEATTQSK